MNFIAWGTSLGFLSVLLGAFGAHAFKTHLSVEHFSIYQTAVQYQMFHALGVLGYGIFRSVYPDVSSWPGFVMLMGVIVFSGSLYLLVLTGWTKLGMITPFGGLMMLAGWAGFFIKAVRLPS